MVKIAMTGTAKVLIWNLKDEVVETFSCPCRLKELGFEWKQRTSFVQNKTKPFTTELIISG